MSNFDPVAEVKALKAQTKVIRKRNYSQRKSKLDPYRQKLLAMKKEGASIAEISRWLGKKENKIKVADSTVTRWFKANG